MTIAAAPGALPLQPPLVLTSQFVPKPEIPFEELMRQVGAAGQQDANDSVSG